MGKERQKAIEEKLEWVKGRIAFFNKIKEGLEKQLKEN
jgi:hypothetical protein